MIIDLDYSEWNFIDLGFCTKMALAEVAGGGRFLDSCGQSVSSNSPLSLKKQQLSIACYNRFLHQGSPFANGLSALEEVRVVTCVDGS